MVRRANTIASTTSLPMAQRRLPAEHVMRVPWDALLERLTEAPLALDMYIYSHVDLFREIAQLHDTNYVAAGVGRSVSSALMTNIAVPKPLGVVQFPLYTPDVPTLQVEYNALRRGLMQIGVDDDTVAESRTPHHPASDERFCDHWAEVGRDVLQQQLTKKGMAYLQRGCPMHLRPAMWRLVLCSGARPDSEAVYHQLRAEVQRHDLFVDRLVAADAKRMANSDDNYFLFEDVVKATLLLMARDTRLAPGPTHPPAGGTLSEPSAAGAAATTGPRPYATCPPSGVLPFRGLAYYVAPLCFLYSDPAALYTVFAHLYTRFFRRLHTVGSERGGLLRLCLLFERTLQAQHPDLFRHLATTLGLDPLAVALPWLHHAFSGTLPPHQVLLLWDRMLGTDSLYILPLLAVAIFAFRKHDLLAATSAKHAEKLLADCVALNAVALLQSFLFGAADSPS